MARRNRTKQKDDPMSDTTDPQTHEGTHEPFGGVDFERLADTEIRELIEEGLSYLNAEDLTAVIEQATERREGKQSAARSELLERFREEAAKAGLSLESLFPQLAAPTRRRSSGQPIAPKFRHPTDPNLTWSGRGLKPRWAEALIAQGHDMEEFRIKDTAQGTLPHAAE